MNIIRANGYIHYIVLCRSIPVLFQNQLYKRLLYNLDRL